MIFTEDKVIGVVGGMGPQAGVELVNQIVLNTGAIQDQDHISTILMSFPKYISDRTAFLEGKTTINPAINIAKIIDKLEGSGADVVGIACNTSHSPEIFDVILDALTKRESKVKLLNMPFETCQYLRSTFPTVQRIGLMATNGTYKSKVYNAMLSMFGFEVVLPDPEFQNDVIHDMIYNKEYGIKSNPRSISNQALDLMDKTLAFFKNKGTEVIVLGCTELSLLMSGPVASNMILIDSTKVLAQSLLREAINDVSLSKEQSLENAIF